MSKLTTKQISYGNRAIAELLAGLEEHGIKLIRSTRDDHVYMVPPDCAQVGLTDISEEEDEDLFNESTRVRNHPVHGEYNHFDSEITAWDTAKFPGR